MGPADHEAKGEMESGEALLSALMELNDDEAQLAFACDLLEDTPYSFLPIVVFRRLGFLPGSRDRIAASIELACAKLDERASRRGFLLRFVSNFFLPDHPEEALRCVARAHQADGDRRNTVQVISAGVGRIGRARYAEAYSRLRADGVVGSDLERLVDRALSEDARIASTLEDHLERIVKVCRAHDSEPVLLLYPEENTMVDSVVREVAALRAVGLVDPQPVFKYLLGTVPRERLFIQDGHCTGEGYRRLGELIANDALDRLSR